MSIDSNIDYFSDFEKAVQNNAVMVTFEYRKEKGIGKKFSHTPLSAEFRVLGLPPLHNAHR